MVVVLPAWVTARLLVGAGWLVAELLADGSRKELPRPAPEFENEEPSPPCPPPPLCR